MWESRFVRVFVPIVLLVLHRQISGRIRWIPIWMRCAGRSGRRQRWQKERYWIRFISAGEHRRHCLPGNWIVCFLCIEQNFSMETVQEYTVEAGRPDSITKEKLKVIRKYPVTRISINPQTMQQKTLDLVGRKHTVGDVKTIFHLARTLGFDNINMDLIAGLPGESAEDMRDTLAQIEQLGPDSLTIHSLAIKRAAKMGQDAKVNRTSKSEKTFSSEIGQMVEDGAAAARRMGLLPYYLYRQKNIAGNFENVGYAKVDKAGIYNILIMEEKQTILACGAGAGTKIVLPEKMTLENGKTTNLIRIENVKNITEYISRIDEMIERKGEWLWH